MNINLTEYYEKYLFDIDNFMFYFILKSTKFNNLNLNINEILESNIYKVLRLVTSMFKGDIIEYASNIQKIKDRVDNEGIYDQEMKKPLVSYNFQFSKFNPTLPIDVATEDENFKLPENFVNSEIVFVNLATDVCNSYYDKSNIYYRLVKDMLFDYKLKVTS
jgi:hypothetical protein